MNSRKQILNNIRTGDRNVNEDLPILIERVSHEIRILTIGSWRSALKKLLLKIPLYTLPEAKTAGELAGKL